MAAIGRCTSNWLSQTIPRDSPANASLDRIEPNIEKTQNRIFQHRGDGFDYLQSRSDTQSAISKSAIQERKMFTLLMGRILPLKITTEVKQQHLKEKMTIHEAVADLKALGLDPLLAFYLQRYPIGRDESDPSWADGIDLDAAYDLLTDVTPPKDDTGNGTT
jgi:hypothetical protein